MPPSQIALDEAPSLALPDAPALHPLGRRWADSTQRQRLLQTPHLEVARGFVQRLFRPHRLTPQRANAALQVDLQHLPAGWLSFTSLTYGAEVEIAPGPMEDFYLLQIPLRGQAQIESGTQSFVSNLHCASLLSPSPDVRMHWGADNQQLCLRIGSSVMERFLSVWLGQRPRSLPTFDAQVRWSQHGKLLQTLTSLLELAQAQALQQGQHSAAQAQPLLQATDKSVQPYLLSKVQLEYQVLVALLHQQAHDLGEVWTQGSPPLSPAFVRRVEDYLVAHCEQAITPEDLAVLAGVSVRSLYLGFHRYRGISPMEMLRQLRMQRVRSELLAGLPQARVGDVALRWGFSHMGRFSQSYLQTYGELPSETLRQAQLAHKR